MPKSVSHRALNREYNARRRREQPWQGWYGLKRWKDLRSAQLARQPLCERCLSQGRVTPATVAHHVVPHRGDATLFWQGTLSSSCADCHDIDEQRIERGGQARQTVGVDGWPMG